MTKGIIPHETNQLLTAINEGQRAMLTQQTPKSAILTRKGKGGKVFSYVPHAWVTEMLNEAFGWAWSWDIQEWRAFPEADPTEVFVLGKLTVHTPHGDLVKSQFGSSDVKRDRQNNILSLGDEFKSASSDALKKAASLLGIGLDLYHADVKPTDDDTERGLSDDPMTAYWAATKAKGMTQVEGAALLTKHRGNPDRALAELAQHAAAPAPKTEPEPPKTQANGGNNGTYPNPLPTTGNDFFKAVNEHRQDPFDNLYELRAAIRKAKGDDRWNWPPPSNVAEWKTVWNLASTYVRVAA